ncbi:kinase-like domain-containing protein [Aspergillus avenaceus]|uniref:Kinase-like domain-containing protein n=1 Tax=Aspergillus avenaceus TaxID=36643 RepID=A0A5N6U1E7_ASPAV|nr:kinase-like domain-containing protein [Aspergillus avenaceus]
MSQHPQPKIFTYAHFNLEALCHRVSKLRQDVPCVSTADQRPASGSFNWAVLISFDDGIRWVFRSPHRRFSMPLEVVMKLLASEVATMRYISAYSDIPVPEIFDYCVSCDNDIGIPYILMSEARGWPLSKVWRPVGSPLDDLDASSKGKVLRELGDITWKLSQLRLGRIGSPFEENGSFEVKECLSRGHMLHERYDLEIPRGPFASDAEFYNSLISAFLEHAEALQLSHHCFIAPVPLPNNYEMRTLYTDAVNLWNDFVAVGNKIDSSINRRDYVIAGDALRDILARDIIPSLESPETTEETFPLCHPDLSVNNIFVDDDINITCIIDWAFASSIPEFMLLPAPGLPQYGDEVSSQLRLRFTDGFIAALPESTEKRSVDKYRKSLEQSQLSWKNIGKYFFQQRCSPHYIQILNELQKDDQQPEKVEKEEREYFRNREFRHTIARKLTLVSEWNLQHGVSMPRRLRRDMFVASPKLWKWILEFIQDWEETF